MARAKENTNRKAPLSDGDTWRKKTWSYSKKQGKQWKKWNKSISDPATTASVLERAAADVLPHERFRHDHYFVSKSMYRNGFYVLEAIAAQPNVPASLLAEIVDYAPGAAHAFCRNPIAPLVLLEKPDFPAALTARGQLALLRESAIPPTFVPLIKAFPQSEAVEDAAARHIAVAGEMGAGSGWQEEIRRFYQSACANTAGSDAEWHTELVEMDLAPLWAYNGTLPIPPPAPLESTPSRFGRYEFLDKWFLVPPPVDSPEESYMLRQIGPNIEDKNVLARGLRADATSADLLRLAQAIPNTRGLVIQAVFRHPSLDAAVLEALAAIKDGVPMGELVVHEQAGVNLLRRLLQDASPMVYRLARRHKNAPPNALEIMRDAFALRIKYDESPSSFSFGSFVGSLHFGHLRSAHAIAEMVQSLDWKGRLEAILVAGHHPDALKDDEAKRTSTDLLHHLAQDGNRLVRAAARAYLADPNTRFVL